MEQEIIEWMRECFHVHPDAGLLIWKKPPYNHPRLLGQIAGRYVAGGGKRYCHIKRNRRALKRGRLIFLWVHGRWPSPCLDHIDGNSENDSINNLREATIAQNTWNHKKHAKKSSLPMGVRLIPKSGRYGARIGQIALGAYDTPEEAHQVYLTKRKELFGEFA